MQRWGYRKTTSFRPRIAKIIDRLVKAAPSNAEWQRDLSVSYIKVGDVQVAQGDLPAALTSYRSSLGIRERLSKANPSNTEWQRDLSVSYIKVGDDANGTGRSARSAKILSR